MLISHVHIFSCSSRVVNLFSDAVTKYLSLHKKLFNIAFKPKYHFILHYVRIMLQYGPLNTMSSIRFEAKHKELKHYAKVITSRINPSYTLALKHQLRLCHRFVCNEGFSNRLVHEVKVTKFVEVLEYLDLKNILCQEIIHDDLVTVSWAVVNGTRYEVNNVVCTNIYDRSFGKIQYIMLDKKKEVYFVLVKLSTLSFNRHKSAYQILKQDQCFFIKQNDLIDYHVYFITNKNYIFCENLFEL